MAELAENIYGDALFQSAVEENQLDEVKKQIDTLAAVFQAEPQFLSMMDSPAIDAQDKRNILKDAFDGKVNGMLYNFLRILCDKKRMGLFLPIAERFAALYRQHLGLLEVEAVTAVALTAGQQERLAQKLSALTGKQIVLTNQVDASFIVGIVLKYDHKEINGSVWDKLESLRQRIRAVIA